MIINNNKSALAMAVLATLPSLVLAQTQPAQVQSHLSLGNQFTEVPKNGMQSYFGGLYNNSEHKKLLGVYLDGKWQFQQKLFVQVNYDKTTRTSTTLSQGYYGLGITLPFVDDSHWFGSIGYASYKAKRETNTKPRRDNDGGGASAETGLIIPMNPRWQMETSYRFADFEGSGQHQLNWNNQILLGNHSAIEINFAYRDWQSLNQVNYQLGYRYRF
ncbi:hypothetical protein [Paraferrimonas haliotis]|uniref:Outer membrane protein beta-barrel domain-containing protein n=1 Tax=Paraferrimonas haliotis TaxID=2013866 RepID=A0AA37TV14_9GAMM|nr:hypothetical protein [Paraferrimonas haliotis]GLS82331.1 hypothetical protein GCM10007894_03080 [Paraferrimonas haliotis]